jgi:hypothetical protein
LQYACIFPLDAPRDCTLVAEDKGCDCKPSELADVNMVAYNKPLCQPAGTTATGTTQYFAKGYPGLRELQVLKDYGPNSIVASICPKQTTGAVDDPNYGYNPAVGAIIDRLKEVLHGRCLPRKLTPDATTGLVPCSIVEATAGSAGCDCDMRPGRTRVPLSQTAVDPDAKPGDDPLRLQKLDAAVRDGLKNNLGVCDKPGKPACSSFCLCEIRQADSTVATSGGQSLQQACQDGILSPTDTQRNPLAGYCYVDNPASPLLQNCAPTEKRILQFVGSNTPWKGATTFIACAGGVVQEDAGM